MVNQKLLEKYIESGWNVLLQGEHGVGKTMILSQACKSLGLQLKYYSASSLDPYTDLVGIPKFVTKEDGTEIIKSIRPEEINDAEVVFFDELNRAEPKVLNAVFELVQFGSINGEKLPNLKCVVAAQNPPGGDYTVESLDPALADRFHICLDIKPDVSRSYLSTVLEEDTVEALIKWYKAHGKKADYISPRRIEMLGHVWEATEDRFSLAAAMPPGGTFDVGKLYNLLNNTALPEELEELLDRPIEQVAASIRKMGPSRVNVTLKDATPDQKKQALSNIASAMNLGFGPVTIEEYLDVIDQMEEGHVNTMVCGWTPAKRRGMATSKKIREYQGLGGMARFKELLDE